MSVCVSLEKIPAKLKDCIAEVCADLGIGVSENGSSLRVSKGDSFKAALKNGCYSITYRKKCELFRGLSMLDGLSENDKITVDAPSPEMLCYMVDESRNAVMNHDGIRHLVRTLAALGYDSLMLYTEDTYEVPGYPYFGHMRGRFSEKELREIDDYAFSFGIEVIPCIQTLAHLATAIRWPGLRAFSDTGDILLAGDDRTYAFVRACLETCSRCFRSRRINIGMDEAHSLGLGTYLKKHGYRKASDIMLEHLGVVAGICKELGLAPMMWSDMFFRMAFGGAYYVREGEIAQDIMDKVPENVTLVYWDYYSLDTQRVDHMLDCHLKFSNPVAFAGGAWKWSCIAPHNKFSLVSTKLQLDSCATHGIGQVIVTGWGDNGGEAAQFSTLPVLLYYAERLYAGHDVDETLLKKRSVQVFGAEWDDLLLFDLPNDMPGTAAGEVSHPVNPCKYLLYNDPLEGLFDKHMDDDVSAQYASFAKSLLAHASDKRWGYIYNSLGTLCDLLAVKADLGVRITAAYKAGDKTALRELATSVIPACIAKLDVFTAAFRKQWYTENKHFGFGNEEIRLGGLKGRLESAKMRIEEYISGETDVIEELDEPRLWFDYRKEGEIRTRYICYNSWSGNATVGQM
ncbi:MAG: beta-N-acetylhexosaminidase [Clostridia bacterium]|nr:beta-N-acetylhexosaminidase [Clostridia bacterium]